VELGLLPREESESTEEPDTAEPSRTALHVRLGMKLAEIGPEETRRRGILPPRSALKVEAVRSGSPADRANLRSGDVILSVARREVGSVSDFDTLLRRLREEGESEALLHVRRDSSFFTLLPLEP